MLEFCSRSEGADLQQPRQPSRNPHTADGIELWLVNENGVISALDVQ
jgi:hypothetical protein